MLGPSNLTWGVQFPGVLRDGAIGYTFALA